MNFITTTVIHQFSKIEKRSLFNPLKSRNLFFFIGFSIFSIHVNLYFAQTCSVGGNGADYGNDSWIGYVYDHNGSGSPVINPFATYKGYVTEPAFFHRDWNTGSPGCASANNFSVRYKMTKNFPCGTYTFTIGGDDGVRLSVDGGATWLVSDWVDHSFRTIKSREVWLSGSTNLVFEFYEKSGVARVSFSYSAKHGPSGISAGADKTICTGGESVVLNGSVANNPALFSEDFENYGTVYPLSTVDAGWETASVTNSTWNWQIKNSCGSKSLNLRSGAGVDCDYTYNDNGNKIAWYGTAINTSSGTAVMDFRWKAFGEVSGSNFYDYGNVIYSTNGGTSWTDLPTRYYNASDWQQVTNLALPSNNNLTIGFRWRNDNSVGNAPGFVIDDIVVKDPSLLSYSWSGGPIVSGGNTLNPIVNPSVTTTYTLTVTGNGCSQSDDVLVTVLTPQGNPSSFGDNVWNVYGYNGDETDLSLNIYRGFYTQPDLGGGDFGVETSNFWGSYNSPSDAGVDINSGSLWNGCLIDDGANTFVHKRKGFPCGNYTFTMDNWDDETRLIIDGVNVWSCGVWSGNASGYINSNSSVYSCEETTAFTVLLDADSEVELQTFEQGGASGVGVNIVKDAPVSIASTSSADRTCRVKGTNIIYFQDKHDNKVIAAINPNGNNLGKVTITSYLDSNPLSIPSCNHPTNLRYATATMARRWVITPEFPPSSAVTVHLPFSDTEFNDLVADANSNSNPNDDLTSISDLKLTKYSGINENGLFSDNCGGGSVTLHSSSGTGVVNSVMPSISNASYASYSVSSFSEFWLHGSVVSPLPVELTSFSATCNQGVLIYWTTASEKNSDYFVVEKSRDGHHWVFVGEQNAAGSSNTTINYSHTDEQIWSGLSYYRLKQIDFDGKQEVFGPISVSCGNNENLMKVFPNPNNGLFTIQVSSNESYPKAELLLTDMTGRIISSKEVNILKGSTQFLMNNSELQKGSYIVSIKGTDMSLKNIKVIVN